MVEIALMEPSKETDNKLRWKADVEGVSFKLYVPKWRVPRPWPTRILVRVSEVPAGGEDQPPKFSGSSPESVKAEHAAEVRPP